MTSVGTRAEIQFIPAGAGRSGQRLVIHHRPASTPVRGSVVHVHPFADEMNKSRRMAALQSRLLAESGFAVLQVDLTGCGDSSGAFQEASWEDWIQDVLLAAAFLQQHHDGPACLWGHRSGCLLALEAAQRMAQVPQLLFWQPPGSGQQLLQQFLRLKTAGTALERKSTVSPPDDRKRLAAGESVEVGGYVLPSAVAKGLETATLAPPSRPSSSVWLELSLRDELAALPATRNAREAWVASGHRVELRVERGPAFWQTQEIEDAPALLAATVDGLLGAVTPT